MKSFLELFAESKMKSGEIVIIKNANRYDALLGKVIKGEILDIRSNGDISVKVGKGNVIAKKSDVVVKTNPEYKKLEKLVK